jgi:hypothetical protein
MSAIIKKLIPIRDQNAAALSGAGTTYSYEYYAFNVFMQGIFYLNVTAITGSATPTLTVTIQELDEQLDPNAAGSWHDLAPAFTAVTATGKQRIIINPIGMRLRAKYVITGTSPAFTFTVTGVGIA